MLTINRNSWHYKYFGRQWDRNPRSLCWYFWKVVLTIFWNIIQITFAAIFSLMVLYVLVLPLVQLWHSYDGGAYAAAFILWALIGWFAIYNYRDYLYYSGKLARPQPKPPGIVAEYVHAKHHKICPLLKYE